jgi:hypothetical protein
MIKTILSILFVFGQVRYKKPEDDAVRRCWICEELFLSYQDNQHLVCCDCKDAVKKYGYRSHVWYFSKLRKKSLTRFTGIDSNFSD